MCLHMVPFRTAQDNAAQARSTLDEVSAALRAAATPEGLSCTAFAHMAS